MVEKAKKVAIAAVRPWSKVLTGFFSIAATVALAWALTHTTLDNAHQETLSYLTWYRDFALGILLAFGAKTITDRRLNGRIGDDKN